MVEIKIDPEFQSLVPPMAEDEKRELEASLLSEGNRDPIVVWEGQGILVDGHSRYEICNRLGVELKPPLEMEFDDRDEVKVWILRNQLGRRNLNPFVRTSLTLKLEELIRPKAKENLVTSTGGLKPRPLQKSAKAEPVDVRKEVAKIAGVSHDTVAKVKVIEQKATPEQREKLVKGDESINAVYKEVKRQEKREKREEQRRQLVAEASSRPATDDSGILVGDLSLLDAKLDDDSVDLFFTDPPYKGDDDSVALYGRLADLAQAKLKPGGLCLAYTPHAHLSDIIKAMVTKDRLSFCWVFAVEQMGGEARIWKYNFWVKWKPILVLTKAPPVKRLTDTWVMDSIRGEGEDKRFHDWGQDVREAAYWIEALTPTGGLVVDPFCGGGTVPFAVRLCGDGLHCIACDKDEASVLLTRARLEAVSGES